MFKIKFIAIFKAYLLRHQKYRPYNVKKRKSVIRLIQTDIAPVALKVLTNKLIKALVQFSQYYCCHWSCYQALKLVF